ncbi:spore germination protein D [Terribacillus aidingensis]|uniref:Spore germination protein D n=1 Tax=Terribacillus aidingensis TaxID=586416 RepID=A0A285P997_9BACI|nr:spore germination lipoprotein GerD [Terribacillus aidingensis]SNZ18008.1 spore germination protein D [Terribacillus aidingensis]
MYVRIVPILFLSLFVLASCTGGGQAAESSQPDYDTTKQMVADILKTDEGKKAISEVMSDETMQDLVSLDASKVEDAINKSWTSEEGKKFWKERFEDPEFVAAFAKNIGPEQKKLMKELMNDSGFQKQVLQIMQDPKMQEQMLSVMKSQEFRKEIEKTIQESAETPMFEQKLMQTVQKALEEAQSKQKEK